MSNPSLFILFLALFKRDTQACHTTKQNTSSQVPFKRHNILSSEAFLGQSECLAPHRVSGIGIERGTHNNAIYGILRNLRHCQSFLNLLKKLLQIELAAQNMKLHFLASLKNIFFLIEVVWLFSSSFK